MTILVREPSAEVIYLQGVCFEHTWEGRSWHETPVDDCRCGTPTTVPTGVPWPPVPTGEPRIRRLRNGKSAAGV